MKNKEKIKQAAKMRRHKKVRSKICGTEKIPRLSVFKSAKGMYVQLINDDIGITIASVSEKEAKGKTKVYIAKEIGKLIAKKGQEKKIEKVVFDKGSNKYHGRVKAVAEGAREGGLIF
ncbi:MAG: 50S ribosomal protein L18 [Patescibacteria group bacterium]|nr:50S ribosomal protein L18 [Patescibacteria group bacterium]